MSINKSRRPPRGNTQRRSNVTGFPPYTETLRPGPNEQPVPPEASTTPPPVLVNGSALPKAAPVVVDVVETRSAKNANANDDSPPDSSTRSKEGSPEPGPVKEDPQSHVGEAAAKVPAKDGEIATKGKNTPRADDDDGPRAKSTRGERGDRAERRAKGRRRGMTPTPNPVSVSEGPAPAGASPFKASAKVAEDDKGAAVQAAAPVDLDDRFFAEGVRSESESLAPKANASSSGSYEEEIDPKILLKMHPDVRARRESYYSVVKWLLLGVMVLGLGGYARHRMAEGDQEKAAREMAEYAQTHPPGARDNPPAEPTAAPAAVQAAASSAEPPPPGATAPAEPATAAAPEHAGADKAAPAAPEGKSAEAPVVAAASGSAAAPTAAPPEETAPAKTAAQEKRDCQVFLDRGANAKAIAAGERSVALDPSDGEAWLLLGGAYQVMGRNGDARRAYNSCVKQGKRGPIGDCKAMLQ